MGGRKITTYWWATVPFNCLVTWNQRAKTWFHSCLCYMRYEINGKSNPWSQYSGNTSLLYPPFYGPEAFDISHIQQTGYMQSLRQRMVLFASWETIMQTCNTQMDIFLSNWFSVLLRLITLTHIFLCMPKLVDLILIRVAIFSEFSKADIFHEN